MNTVYLILGGNKGNKLQNLQSALQLISEKAGKIIQQSAIYRTAAWGNTNQPDFLNQAICLQTSLNAPTLLDVLLNIEKTLGRVRTDEKWMERTMDIDILFFNNDIIDSPNLTIPHPFIQERKFVLVPMAEIAPDFIHPVLKKSIGTLLAECTDALEITIYQSLNVE